MKVTSPDPKKQKNREIQIIKKTKNSRKKTGKYFMETRVLEPQIHTPMHI
jgi:hypothetical protein